jgi:hypothetical protein
MAITVKKAALWRKEIDNRPGTLASALEPLARAGADLQVVMAYRYPGADKGAVELHPVSPWRAHNPARADCPPRPAGQDLRTVRDPQSGRLQSASSPTLGDAGINMSFVMAQVVGRRYAAVFGFENEADGAKAATLIKKAATPVRKK